jgi:hypothetical protein
VVHKVGCTALWEAGGLPGRALRGKGALKVGPSKLVVGLFKTYVTLHQTLGNWFHFIEPIDVIKNLLTVKQLLNIATCPG